LSAALAHAPSVLVPATPSPQKLPVPLVPHFGRLPESVPLSIVALPM
jgi:hypothetical protein